MANAANPFIRYRRRLDSYHLAREKGWSDDRFVELVEELDAAVAGVQGHGFAITPTIDGSAVATAAGVECELVLKDETGNVGGSHKSRHLFGLALHQAMAEQAAAPLAIASCGNAALSAAVIAAGLERELQVFVPTWADQAVVERLVGLGASVNQCERQEGQLGDPAFAAYRGAVESGAVPFTVQGTEASAVIDGGRTLGWELGEAIAERFGMGATLDVIYIQVGGGALAAAVSMALFDCVDEGWLANRPRVMTVQPKNAHPLARAWDRLVGDAQSIDPIAVMALARANPDAYMTPWEDPPESLASGILDDITYDWLGVVEAMAATGGRPVLASEDQFASAHRLIAEHTDMVASATGTAGLAGLLVSPPEPEERAAVLITGRT